MSKNAYHMILISLLINNFVNISRDTKSRPLFGHFAHAYGNWGPVLDMRMRTSDGLAHNSTFTRVKGQGFYSSLQMVMRVT